MPGRWSDEGDWQGRNWRSRGYDRNEDERGYRSYGGEERSFDDSARYEGRGGDRVFGERETGAQYNEPNLRSGYGAYRGGEGGFGGRDYQSSYRTESRADYRDRPAWQDRDYQGVSPAMQQGEYDLERNRRTPRFSSQDYTRGGRYYGDDSREPIYREEYGLGGREYGREPRGYDAGYRDYGDNQRLEGRYAREMNRSWSGGTGGYDYERGYGDAGRGYDRDRERGGRSEDFFRRAGERISSWFGGSRDESRDFREREASHRGRGPKGYQRPDERISDEAHQRLTDDPWVDATNIAISVSGGELTLSGTVDSREAKHRAERCVEDISGVKHVQNNLRIEGGNYFTRPASGYGDSVAEAQMRGDGGTSGGTQSGEDSAATRTTTRRT